MMTTGDNKIQGVITRGGRTGKPETIHAVTILLLIVSVSVMCGRPENKQSVVAWTDSVPSFRVDPFWPKPLPNQWLIGQVAGVATDSKNHIWIVHRPNSLGDDEYAPSEKPASGLPYVPAPPVIEFDADGEVVRAWGGPGGGFDWPENPHGIFVDHEDHVWIISIPCSIVRSPAIGPPVTQILTGVGVENDDTVVKVAIGNVDFVGDRIRIDVSRAAQQARIVASPGLSGPPDLEKEYPVPVEF